MKTAFFLYTTGWGGVEIYLQSLMGALSNQLVLKGGKIVLFLYSPPGAVRDRVASAFAALGAEVRELDHFGVPKFSFSGGGEKPLAPSSVRNTMTASADLIGSGKRSWSGMAARLVPGDLKSLWHSWKQIREGAAVLKQSEIDVAHFLHGAYPSLKLAMLSAWAAGIKIRISDIHGEPKAESWKGFAAGILSFFAVRSATVIKVLSACMASQLGARCGVWNQVRIIPNGINAEGFVDCGPNAGIREKCGIPSESKVGCVAGRLFERKGCEDVIDAVAKIPGDKRPHILFLGEGPLESLLKESVCQHGLEKSVHFLGFKKDVASVLNECDFLLMPSHSEGAPLVVLEAMAMGLPVVSTRVGAMTELLGPEYPGQLVVDCNVPDKLGSAIQELLSMPDGEREALGQILWRRVRSYYNQVSINQEIFKLYEVH